MGARFTLTQKQVRDLIAMTPEGHVAEIKISFPKDKADAPTARPADLVDP